MPALSINGKLVSESGIVILEAEDVGAIPADQIGQPGGVAQLDGDGRIPADQVPAAATPEQGAKADTALQPEDIGVAGGVAGLGVDGKLPSSVLPALAITEPFVVASQAAQLALVAQEGDVAIRTDISKTYIKTANTTGTMADWAELLQPGAPVQSVNGQTGTVNITAASINAATAAQGAKADAALPAASVGAASGAASLDANARVPLIQMPLSAGPSFRNRIINGAFDFWQRNTSSPIVGYSSVDRFLNNCNASSCTLSRQPLPAGSFGSGIYSPPYFLRAVVSSANTASCYSTIQHRFERLIEYSGRTITLSGRVRASVAGLKIAPEFTINFGVGGSATVTTLGVTTWALGTTWAKYKTTLTIPDLSGYTLGTPGTESLNFNLWMDSGANNASRNNSLGYQSGTFDISCLQLDFENVATDFEVIPAEIQLIRCQRFYEKGYDVDVIPVDFDSSVLTHPGVCFSSAAARITVPFKVPKRAAPTISFLAPSVSNTAGRWALFNSTSAWATSNSTTVINTKTHGFNAELGFSGGLSYGQVALASGGWMADSEL